GAGGGGRENQKTGNEQNFETRNIGPIRSNRHCKLLTYTRNGYGFRIRRLMLSKNVGRMLKTRGATAIFRARPLGLAVNARRCRAAFARLAAIRFGPASRCGSWLLS